MRLSFYKMSEPPTIHLLTGQTGIGKTELALRWAEANDAEILSCDALLFYRGMDIGTAKPNSAELARVPHHGIDICDPAEVFDIAAFVEYAGGVVADVFARRRQLLVCGGSGFYLKSFLEPVTDAVAVPEAIAREVARIETEQGIEAMREALRAANPGGIAMPLDWNNPRRLAKALERCLASGKTCDALYEEFRALPKPFPGYRKQTCLLQRDLAELKARCVRRVDQMLETGLLAEVGRLMEQGIDNNPTARSAIGYRECIAHIRSGGSIEALKAEIVQNTYHLIRKQRKWFRNQLEPDFVYPLAEGDAGDFRRMFSPESAFTGRPFSQ